MIKSAFHRLKQLLFALMGAGALCFVSCTIDDTADMPWPGDSEQSDYVRVSASVRATLVSRAAQELGQVEQGEFVLTYPFSLSVVNNDSTYTYSTAKVKFGTEGLGNMGFVTYFDTQKGDNVSLKWSEVVLRKAPSTVNGVTPPPTAIFYLDNMPTSLHNAESEWQKTLNTHQNLVIFYDDEDNPAPENINPFRAGLFDHENGTNDLLWGWTVAEKNAKIVKFENTDRGDYRLHHNMSRLRVVIDAKQRDDDTEEVVDFSHEVKLRLHKLHHEPLYFDRSTGNLTLQQSPEEENVLTLVQFENDEVAGTAPTDADDSDLAVIPWAKIEEVKDTDNPGKTFLRYTSYDFVVPPQELANDDKRPLLQLIVPAQYVPGKKPDDPAVYYEANLPQNMYYVKQEGDDATDLPAMPFSFMKEYDMTIRAVVGPPDLELRFAPVQVQDWVNFGVQEISGNQAGIYTNQDFYDFLDCYRNENDVRLERYGYRASNDEPWKILFWSSALKLHMKDEEITASDGTKKTEKGIENYLKDYVNTKFFEDNPFQFVFNNNVVNLTDDKQYPQLDGASGQLRLYSYVTGEEVVYPGIKNTGDFLDMIKAYNSKSFKSLLPSYGAYDNTYEQWEIEFTENAGGAAGAPIELDYDDIAKTMFFFGEDTKGGAGNFKFNFRGHPITINNIPDPDDANKTISVKLEGIEGEQILHAIVANPAGLYSPEDVALLIRAYNSLDTSEPDTDDDGDSQPDNGGMVDEPVDLRWLLPHFGVEANGKWTFRFIKPMELNGPDIYGTMVPNIENNLPDYDFVAVGSTGANDNTLMIKVSDTGSQQYTYSFTNSSFASSLKKLFAKGGIITTAGNISSMISYANNGNPVYRRYYGWYDESNSQWIYPINPTAGTDGIRKIEVDYATIFAKLTSTEPTVFQLLNDSRVVVTNLPNGAPDLICRGEQGAELLYKILRGYYTPEDYKPGIELSSDFGDLFTAYNESNLVALQRYGIFDEAQNKWIFKFTETAEQPMNVDFSTLVGKMKPNQDIEYAFDFGAHVLTLELPVGSNPTTLNIAGSSGAALLHAILTNQQKLTSPDDVEWMIQAYNGMVMAPTALNLTRGVASASVPAYGPIFDFSSAVRPASVSQSANYVAASPANDEPVRGTFDWILGLYGAKNGNTWNFHYANTMELNGPAIYGKMTPDSGSGKPEYIFTFDFEIVPDVGDGQDSQPAEKYVTVVDDSFREHVGGYLKRLFTGNGEITSADELVRFAAMTRENPILWRYFGKPSSDTNMTWTFPITATGFISAAYNDLFGKFQNIADSKFTLTLNDGLTVKVTPLPDVNYRKIECSGSDGAATLKSILRGTYKNPNPEIKTKADFEALIAAYNSNPIQTEELPTYGKFDDSKWTFHVSDALTLSIDDIYGKMTAGGSKPDYEFTYDTPNGNVTIDGKSVDAAHLKILLAASGAVNSKADLLALLDNDAITRRYYGTPNGSTSITWNFTVKTTIESVEWDDIYGKFMGNDDLAFTLASGVSVKVTELPGGRQLTCSGANGATILAQILKGVYEPEKGIMNASEVEALAAAYTSYDTAKLALYGELNGTTWTFTFRNSAALIGTQVYGKMDPSDKDANYIFAFDSSKSITVTVDDTQVTAAELTVLFAGSGKITSANDLIAAKGANAVKRHLYGTQNGGGQWQFPIVVSNNVLELDYKTCHGLFSDENMQISSIDGGSVTIVNLPGGRTITNCTLTELNQILSGTFTPTPGIELPTDIQKLTSAYNGSNEDEMQVYGERTDAVWTFTFRNSMNLTGSAVYGQMKIDGSKPDYNFVFADNATVQVDNTSVTTVQLKTLFTESGTVASAADLLALLADNAVTRRFYGTLSGSTWTFPISESIANVDWDSVYNKFNGDLVFTIPDNVTVTLINLPDDRLPLDCTGTAGAEDLAKILTGEYEFADESGGDGGGEAGETEQPGNEGN